MATVNPFAARQARAWARQAASDKLTLEQKLAKLPATGAKKERAKLLAKIAAQKTPKKSK